MKGIGTDLVIVARIGASLARNPAFAAEVFAEGERRYCDARARPAQHYAARFAAKEAFLKAVGVGIAGGVALRDVEVTSDASGAPQLRLGASAAAALVRVGATRALVSLSHEGAVAMSVVIVS